MSAQLQKLKPAPLRAKRAPTTYTQVAMMDGRTVQFPGKILMLRENVVIDGIAGVRFDFRDGQTRWLPVANSGLLMEYALHGAGTKVADEAGTAETVNAKVVAVDAVLERLAEGQWSLRPPLAAGEVPKGTPIVLEAICKVTGKPLREVKEFIAKTLAEAAAAGTPMTRAELYETFRAPGAPTASVIEALERREREAAAGAAPAKASELLNKLM